jgi:selenocysteine lyase/cysteine desulfurase
MSLESPAAPATAHPAQRRLRKSTDKPLNVPKAMASVDSDSAWRRLREEFPITATRAYLFAGGMAPLCSAARAAIEAFSTLWARDPVALYREYAGEQAKLLRAEVAALIGAGADDVAIVDSTSRGNNLAVQMLEAPPGSNVVVDSTTYPSALYPWLLRDAVEIRHVASVEGRPSLADLERRVDARTVAVSVSHVCRLSGFRHNLRVLARIAHAVGAVLLVDAAQSVGAIRIDVREDDLDFLSFGAMKWLLGMPGVAFFYVRPELQERWRPPHVGRARIESGELLLPAGGARHELSTLSWGALAASREGVRLLTSVAFESVESRVLDLSGSVVTGLLERGVHVWTPPERSARAGIVAFECGVPDRLRGFLRERGVDVWGWEERRLMRVDPHVYNDEEDIACFFEGYDILGRLPDD